MQRRNWFEVDGETIPASESMHLMVLNEDELDNLPGSNGMLAFTVDTQRFYVYKKPQPVMYRDPAPAKKKSILRRWLRRAGWRS